MSNKRYFKIRRSTLWLLLLCCLTLMPPVSGAEHYDYTRDKEWLHLNIFDWLSFGPPIVGCSKRVDLYVNDACVAKATDESRGLSEIKRWIRANISPKMNMSPNDTDTRPTHPRDRLMLYCKDNPAADDLLLIIPLSPRMLNTGPAEFQKQLDQLKVKMASSH